MHHAPRLTPVTVTVALALAAGCAPREAELTAALPDRDVVTIELPAGQNLQGLSTTTSGAPLVGEPADMYTHTYYAARDLNGLGVGVVSLLEAITAYPATSMDETSAVWGPFSDSDEPNEHVLRIERVEGDSSEHFVWAIASKHKSAPIEDFVAIAAGAFEPAGGDDGRGWFAIDFDLIRTLNPQENGQGRIAYAYEKRGSEVGVLVHYEGLDETGAPSEASYGYGENGDGEKFVLFAFAADIDDGNEGRTAKEDVVILSRWQHGPGRADLVATGGDLGASTAYGSQCWDATFVSTFEHVTVDGTILAASGDPASCALPVAEPPSAEALPSAADVESPYGLPSE
ncbi:hypothetical protein L6R52_23085 [Myxococcota bacterium]|nr:hypothetical protein [Myxococcota bacterium]